MELPPVIALACYIDESTRGRFFSVAGYLGTVDFWDRIFTPEWTKALASAPRPLSEFKASNCRQKRGEFLGWSQEECDSLVKSLISVLVRTRSIMGFASVLRLPGVVAPGFPDTKRQRVLVERCGYKGGAFACLYDSIQYGTQFFSPDIEYVQPIADERKKFYKILLEAYADARRLSEFPGKVKCPIGADSRALPPLQAADVLAYEARKEVENRMENRRISIAMQRMFDGLPHFARCTYMPDVPIVGAQLLSDVGFVSDNISTEVLFRPDMPIRAKGNWGVP
jgi:hypothetical protein